METLNFMIGSVLVLGIVTACAIYIIDKYLNKNIEDTFSEK